MADNFDLLGRLHAHQRGKAVRIATHRQVSIARHALVIAPLAMAGEDTAIHAIAVGRWGQTPQTRVVPDPRVREDQYKLVEWLGDIVERYFQTCRENGEHPQIWVSSGAAAGHLDILADRLRFTRDAPTIKRAGELLTYNTERMPVAGQQALITATGALSLHYCTGQQEGEDEHLGVFLTWIDPPKGKTIAQAIEIAEREVMGVKTDPLFDRDELQPLVSAYNTARKDGASAAELKRRAGAIEDRLLPIVLRIYDSIQQAATFIRDLPEAGMVGELSTTECEEFESFMQARDKGLPLPYRDSPKAGAFKIAARELAASNVDAGAIYGDDTALARARLSGDVLSGVLQKHTQMKVPRKTIHRFEVETNQPTLHLRSGDELAWMADPRLHCVVENVQRAGARTTVSFVVSAGMNSPGVPAEGTAVDIAPPPPDRGQIWRNRKQMGKRLSTTPWTHSAAELPQREPPPKSRRPNDLLAAVENLK